MSKQRYIDLILLYKFNKLEFNQQIKLENKSNFFYFLSHDRSLTIDGYKEIKNYINNH